MSIPLAAPLGDARHAGAHDHKSGCHRRLLQSEREVSGQPTRVSTWREDDSREGGAGEIRLPDRDTPESCCSGIFCQSDQFGLVLGGENDQVVALPMPPLGDFRVSAGIRKGRVSGLCKLLTWGKVGAGDDVELGVCAGLLLCSLREFHDRYFPLCCGLCLATSHAWW